MSFPTSPILGTRYVVGSSEYRWNGYAWDIVVPYVPTSMTINPQEITATAGQTVFNCTYNPTYVEVLINGIQLSKTDYTATNGTTVVLNIGATLGDLVTVREYDTFNVANVDHGSLTGLADDDHAQYHNDTRGDARYLQLTGGSLTGKLGFTEVDKGTVSTGTVTFTQSAGNVQRLQVGGALTIATTGWAASGIFSDLVLKLVNAGSATVTLPTINWIKPDGTMTTTFSAYLTAIARPALQTSGTDFMYLFSDDAGSTLYGKLI